DFVCPWCYLCTPRVARLQQSLNIDVQWVYFPLHPDTPAEGLLLKDLFAGRNFDIEAAQAHLKTLLDAEGLPFNSRTHTYNSRLAQELAKAFDSLRDALYSAYFKDSRNISDVDVLVDIAATNGISPDDAHRVLTERTHKSAVDADWALARSYGITGVPSFVAGGRKVVGAQPYSTLEKLIAMAS
ncbi:MAG TPA: DsbA family protein, partial [Terriglobia bacterium]|nr:DsbA family protein [Terriglobia bacterium]